MKYQCQNLIEDQQIYLLNMLKKINSCSMEHYIHGKHNQYI